MDKFYENIERYLLGELTGNELRDFENALQSDPTLAKSVVQHRELMQRLDTLRLRNKVKSALEAPKTKTVPLYAHRSFLAIAASLILLAAAIWFFNLPSQPSTEFVQTPFPTTPNPSAKSTESTPINPTQSTPSTESTPSTPDPIALARSFREQPTQTFVRDAAEPDEDPATAPTPTQQAAEAYFKQNYRATVEFLKAEKLVSEDESARYIRAQAFFSLNQFSAAAADFQALENSFQFKNEARWNFMLCQLALGKTEKAKALCSAMTADQDFPFRKKALELQAKLKF